MKKEKKRVMRYDYKKKKPIRKAVTVLAKKCCYCGEIKHASEFYRSRKSKDGLRYDCKECGNEKTRIASYWKRIEEKVDVRV